MNRFIFTVALLLVAALACAYSAALPYNWQYGESVYGQQVQYNFDVLVATDTAILATQAYLLNTVRDIATSTPASVLVTASTSYLLFSWAIPSSATTDFFCQVSAIGPNSGGRQKFKKDFWGGIYNDASGTAFINTPTSLTDYTTSASAWDAVASYSSGYFRVLASSPANVKWFVKFYPCTSTY